MLKAWVAISFASVIFININTLLRFLQVIVWKRVVEINEDLAMTKWSPEALYRSVYRRPTVGHV